MRFQVCGFFEVPRQGRWIARTREDKREFWEVVDAHFPGLPDACGCYLFCIRGKTWYVGMAESQTFRNECFALHKIVQYNEALQSVSGRPSLVFLAKMTPSNRFARPSANGHRDVQLLENLLIGAALRRNERLQNIRGTKLLRNMNVPAFLNSERGQGKSAAAQGLKLVLGL